MGTRVPRGWTAGPSCLEKGARREAGARDPDCLVLGPWALLSGIEAKKPKQGAAAQFWNRVP